MLVVCVCIVRGIANTNPMKSLGYTLRIRNPKHVRSLLFYIIKTVLNIAALHCGVRMNDDKQDIIRPI